MSDKWKNSLDILLKAIVAIAAVWLSAGCTATLGIQKNSSGATQTVKTEQTVDSIKIDSHAEFK